jgi:predicted permease
VRTFLRRIAYMVQRRRHEAALAEEIEFHRTLTQEDLEQQGLRADEIRPAASRALGNELLARERSRDVWIAPSLQDLAQDLRHAVRILARQPLFTLAAAGAIALGLGAATTGFSLLNAAVIRQLPFDEPDRIVAAGTVDRRNRTVAWPQGYRGVSLPEFLDWREHSSHAFDGLAAYAESTMNLGDEQVAPERLGGAFVSWNAFRLIGQRPAFGRDFSRDDDNPGAPPVVILGHDVWTARYGGRRTVIGRSVRINGMPAVVIGVMPSGFRFPQNADAWQPLSQMPGLPGARDTRELSAFGRLAAGVSLRSAEDALDAVAARLAREYPHTNADVEARVMPFDDRYVAPELKRLMMAVMAAVTFVLVIACANVANLLLARSMARAREFAVRACLGASRWRLMRQTLVESLLVAAIGGVPGFVLGVLGLRAFAAAATAVDRPPYWIAFVVDRRVVLFAAMACLSTAILFGLAPALRMSTIDVHGTLKDGGRTVVGGRRTRLWVATLVVVEIALTFVLLAGAGSMLRRFWGMQHTAAGVETEGLITMRLDLPAREYAPRERRAALLESIEERIDALGPIRSATLADSVPLIGGGRRRVAVEGRQPQAGEAESALAVRIGTRYFETVGIPIVRGRAFDRSDGVAGHDSVIVNERFADRYFAGASALGRRIRVAADAGDLNDSPWLTIVGVCATIPDDDDPPAIVYLPYRAEPPLYAVLLARANVDAPAAVALLRGQVRALDPDLPLWRVRTLEEWLAFLRWPERVFGSMLGMFAGFGLLLSVLGVYSITAQSVSQRTQEIGVRVALGARPADVRWLVLRGTILQLASGLLLALPGALVVDRLPFMEPGGPFALLPFVLLLSAAAVSATFVPLRRATSLDPSVALRVE